MYVYVINQEGNPLMPCKPRKARILLKNKKAKVIRRTPFTIQLLYETTNFTQPMTLGIDPGSKHIGISITNETTVFYESETEIRTDISKNIATRREMRRSRRNRKTRYRKPRFNNRKKKDGWLPPSVEQRLKSHKQEIAFVHSILPITEIILERNSFDIQKIKNPDIKGKEYQRGEQLDYLNVRAYVLFRDHYTCQYCKGKSKDKKLQTHHIESRKTDGDAPNNFVTLCKTCHTYYHQGKLKLPKRIKRGASYRDATMMNIIMERLYEYLKNTYPNVKDTYGYITKYIRETYDLPKEHYIDARCITGHPFARTDGTLYEKSPRAPRLKTQSWGELVSKIYFFP